MLVVALAVSLAARVLKRLRELVAELERHDLLGVVLHDAVVDLGAHGLLAQQDGLTALVVPPQVLDVGHVDAERRKHLVQGVYHVGLVDGIVRRDERCPAVQSPRRVVRLRRRRNVASDGLSGTRVRLRLHGHVIRVNFDRIAHRHLRPRSP